MDSPLGDDGLFDWVMGLQESSSEPPAPNPVSGRRVPVSLLPTMGAGKRSAPSTITSYIGRYAGILPLAPSAYRVPSLMSSALSMSTSDGSEIRTPTSPNSDDPFDEAYTSQSSVFI
jgi:hypothetical protein